MDYLVKLAIFAIYTSVVYAGVRFFLNYLHSVNIPFLNALCQFGVLQGLNIYLTILVTGFIFNKTLSFWK